MSTGNDTIVTTLAPVTSTTTSDPQLILPTTETNDHSTSPDATTNESITKAVTILTSSKDEISTSSYSNATFTPTTTKPDSRCSANQVLQFERIPGFQPKRTVRMTALCYSDFQREDVVNECIKKCREQLTCVGFVLDYRTRTCFGVMVTQRLRQVELTMSAHCDYFDTICVPQHFSCSKLWSSEKIIDQAAYRSPVRMEIIKVSQTNCRHLCHQEKRFSCTSFGYDHHREICRLYDFDRHADAVALSFAPHNDFYDNICAFRYIRCAYLPYEIDVTISTVTRALKVRNALECQRFCDIQQEFTCRSYTFLDMSYKLEKNICLLSSDNKNSGRDDSMRFLPRSFFVAKECRTLKF